MERTGTFLFWLGAAIALGCGVLLSIDPGTVCRLGPSGWPETVLSYQGLCMIFWAYGVPIGLILAATGVLGQAGVSGRRLGLFSAGLLGTYLFITLANRPMPHVPPLFGVGGALVLGFYLMILWENRARLAENTPRLAGYTFLVTAIWFTCGLGSRLYIEAMDSGESPIDILVYYTLAMGFFWLGERRALARTVSARGLPAE